MQHYWMYNTKSSKQCSWDICPCQNQEWTTLKKPQSFFVKREEILISSIRATFYQNNTPWRENVLHKNPSWIHLKFSRKVWVASSIFSWMEVKFLQQWQRVKHMHEESHLWLLVESPFITLPNAKLKLDSQSCLKNTEWWAAMRTLLLLMALSDWFTAQCWLKDWAY